MANNQLEKNQKIQCYQPADNAVELRKSFEQASGFDCEPSYVLSKASDLIKKSKEVGLDGMSEEEKVSLAEWARKVSNMENLNNQSLLAEASMSKYRAFAIDFAGQINVEYDCQSPSEKAMAQNIASAYTRTLSTNEMITNNLSKDSYSDLSCIRLAILSKELDRAQRHFSTSLQLLRQMKSPPLKMSVRADNAFIGQFNYQEPHEENIISQ
jgi:hypothetical protein